MDSFVNASLVAAASKGVVSELDIRLPGLIEGASAAIRNYCGWHVAPVVTETIEFDTWGERVLQLPTLKVVSIASVLVEGVAVTNYQLSKKGMIRFPGPLPYAFGSVVVELVHGHASAPGVDAVIIQAVLGALASPMGATREQAGAVSVQWSTVGLDLTDRDKQILAPYRIPGLG